MEKMVWSCWFWKWINLWKEWQNVYKTIFGVYYYKNHEQQYKNSPIYKIESGRQRKESDFVVVGLQQEKMVLGFGDFSCFYMSPVKNNGQAACLIHETRNKTEDCSSVQFASNIFVCMASSLTTHYDHSKWFCTWLLLRVILCLPLELTTLAWFVLCQLVCVYTLF